MTEKTEKWPAFVKVTKEDILMVLEDVRDALDNRDSKGLVDASNRITHTLSIHGEPRAVYVSIVAYALGKLVEKEYLKEAYKQDWDEFLEGMERNLEAAIELLEHDNIKGFDGALRAMIKLISEFDASFSSYAKEVLDFSRIQKGAKVYEHGLSLSSVAQLLGVSKWELMPKVGETTGHEHRALQTKTARQRYEELKKVLRKRD